MTDLCSCLNIPIHRDWLKINRVRGSVWGIINLPTEDPHANFMGTLHPTKPFFISFTFLFSFGCYTNFLQNITVNFKDFRVLGSIRSDAANIIIHPILPSSPHPLLITLDAPTPVNFTKLVVSQNGIFSCEHWSRRRREEDSSPQCITPTSWVKLKWSTFISTFWWKLAKVGLTFN